MTEPIIDDAKRIALTCRARGVIVLAFGATQFGTASYGMTRADCSAMKSVSEQIFRLIAEGIIVVPDGYAEPQV